jgi:hypothetical protein
MDGGPPPATGGISSSAKPQEMLDLAKSYADAAEHLFAEHRASKMSLQKPARLCALHAIELYLHAFLTFRGATDKQMKDRHHALWHEEFSDRLGLDAKTQQHLKDLTTEKAYLAVRYGCEPPHTMCAETRMKRTLELIREKADLIPFHP